MQSRSYLFLLLVLGLAGLSAFIYFKKDFNYGLDVRGGVRLLYKMDVDKLTPEQRQRMAEIRSNTLDILENRVATGLGVVEGTVVSKGVDEFIIELPGFKDVAEARNTIGTSAKLYAYHAKTVTTEKATFRRYTASSDEKLVGDTPVVTFDMRGSEKTLEPGMPEYKAMIETWDVILEGDDLARAFPEVHAGNLTVPSFRFSAAGAEKMEKWTRSVLNRRENLAFVLDGKVLSIAPVQDGAILRDQAYINGQFDPKYVTRLCELLNAGALPVDLVEIGSQTVDPTIGKQALDQMVTAGLVSFAFITLFLLVYYVFPGLVALIALVLYVLFTLTVMKGIGATFSLAAIAGFIMSVGIAVDANILVFERLKEEMRLGKALDQAIGVGFKRALPAIIDSNVCTILTSLVLANLGTGPVKGFATTLIIGVAISLFTAVTVTRSLLVFLIGSGLGANPKLYGLDRQWFGEGLEAKADKEPLHIVETSKKWFLISGLTIVVGLPFLFMGGLKPNVEFSGGFEGVYAASDDVTTAAILGKLEGAGLNGSNVKFATSEGQRLVYVTVPEIGELKAAKAEDAKAKVTEAAGFKLEDVRGFSTVGPTVRAETYRNAILGVIISTLLIIVYLTARFGFAVGGAKNGIKFALSAVGALLHDVLVVLGVAAIVGYFMGWEISALFITAMLTVIGFSVHDTIVVFDRIRENLRSPVHGEDFGHLCDRSITQSFARSINTSLTVIVTLVILLVMGTATPDLKFFVLAMLVGIVSGTYSSIYNASPILYLWEKAVERKKGIEYGLVAEAERERQRMRAASLTVEAERRAMVDSEGRSYSQVKRRSSAVDRSKINIDDN